MSQRTCAPPLIEMAGAALTSEDVVRAIDAWHGITPPNQVALEFARDLARVIAAFEALAPVEFAAEPSDFARALAEFSDTPK
ncbi:hypothetical protein QBK99_23680 [Corticibacterium sp. UT-5YL-CI-8]|nr:hypothetical protein [Tianweitania sp. UT-5YL-CI-8]